MHNSDIMRATPRVAFLILKDSSAPSCKQFYYSTDETSSSLLLILHSLASYNIVVSFKMGISRSEIIPKKVFIVSFWFHFHFLMSIYEKITDLESERLWMVYYLDQLFSRQRLEWWFGFISKEICVQTIMYCCLDAYRWLHRKFFSIFLRLTISIGLQQLCLNPACKKLRSWYLKMKILKRIFIVEFQCFSGCRFPWAS